MVGNFETALKSFISTTERLENVLELPLSYFAVFDLLCYISWLHADKKTSCERRISILSIRAGIELFQSGKAEEEKTLK